MADSAEDWRDLASIQAIADRLLARRQPTRTDVIALELPPLFDADDVVRICKVGKNAAYEIMHRAGAIKLGRGLRLRPQDLENYLAGLAASGSNAGSNGADIRP